jgi:hypothetical protein
MRLPMTPHRSVYVNGTAEGIIEHGQSSDGSRWRDLIRLGWWWRLIVRPPSDAPEIVGNSRPKESLRL